MDVQLINVYKGCQHFFFKTGAAGYPLVKTFPAEPLVLVHECVLNSPEKPDPPMSQLCL